MQDDILEELNEDMGINQKIKDFLAKNVTSILISAIVIVYIARGIVTLSTSGKTVMEIIGDGVIAWLFAFIISRILEFRGIARGEAAPEYQDAMGRFMETAGKVDPYLEYLDAWCQELNAKKLRAKQMALLLPAGIKYETFVSDEFNIDHYDKEKKPYIRRAMRAKIREISTTYLLSDSKSSFSDKEEDIPSKSDYLKKSARTDAISKIGLTLVFAYYSITLITDFSWATLVWYALQSVLFVAFGVLKNYTGYLYVVEKLTLKIQQKTGTIQLFINEETKREKERIEHERNRRIQEEADARWLAEHHAANERGEHAAPAQGDAGQAEQLSAASAEATAGDPEHLTQIPGPDGQ